jgi:lipase
MHGGVFERMGERLGAAGHSVTAVDLRGHGDSGREPPWNLETHVRDLIETMDRLGIESAAVVGHSFGGRLAIELAARHPERVHRLALLEPAYGVTVELAMRNAEIERLDWSYATADGAVNALLASDTVFAASRDVVAEFAEGDLRRGPDGRLRFSFCPSAAVVAWSEMTLPLPPVAPLPTLVVAAEHSPFTSTEQQRRYEAELGQTFRWAAVPNGHNVLWESPAETIAVVERFLDPDEQPLGGDIAHSSSS